MKKRDLRQQETRVLVMLSPLRQKTIEIGLSYLNAEDSRLQQNSQVRLKVICNDFFLPN